MIAERDDHKMPVLLVGNMTPEMKKEKEEAHKNAMAIKEKMDRKYAEKKKVLMR